MRIQAHRAALRFTAVLCSVLISTQEVLLMAQQNPAPAATANTAQANTGQAGTAPQKIPPEQLDSLVSPIALYPDPMLAQVLAASTYPLEIIQLQQWLTKHK